MSLRTMLTPILKGDLGRFRRRIQRCYKVPTLNLMQMCVWLETRRFERASAERRWALAKRKFFFRVLGTSIPCSSHFSGCAFCKRKIRGWLFFLKNPERAMGDSGVPGETSRRNMEDRRTRANQNGARCLCEEVKCKSNGRKWEGAQKSKAFRNGTRSV